MFLDYILAVGILLIFGLVVFILVNLGKKENENEKGKGKGKSSFCVSCLPRFTDFDTENGIADGIENDIEKQKLIEEQNDPLYTNPPFVLNEIKPIEQYNSFSDYATPKSCVEDDNGFEEFAKNLKCLEYWKEGGAELILPGMASLYQSFNQIKGEIKNAHKLHKLGQKTRADRALQKANIKNTDGSYKVISELTPDDIGDLDPKKRKALMKQLKRDGVVNKNLVIKSFNDAQIEKFVDDIHKRYPGLEDQMRKTYSESELKEIKKKLANVSYDLDVKVHDRIPLNNEVPYKFTDPGLDELTKASRIESMNKLLSDKFSGQITNLEDLKHLDRLCKATPPDLPKIAKFGLGDPTIPSNFDKIKQKASTAIAQMEEAEMTPKMNDVELDALEKKFNDMGIEYKGPSSVADLNFDKPLIDGKPNPNFVDPSKMSDADLDEFLTDLKNKGMIDSRIAVVPDIDVDAKAKKAKNAKDGGQAVRKVVSIVPSSMALQYFDTGNSLSKGDNNKALQKLTDIFDKPPSWKSKVPGDEKALRKLFETYDKNTTKILENLDKITDEQFDLLKRKGVVPPDVSRVPNIDAKNVSTNRFIKAIPDDIDPKMAKLGNAAEAMDPKMAKKMIKAEKAFNSAKNATRAGSVAKGAAGSAAFGAVLVIGIGLATGQSFNDEKFQEQIAGAVVGAVAGEVIEAGAKRAVLGTGGKVAGKNAGKAAIRTGGKAAAKGGMAAAKLSAGAAKAATGVGVFLLVFDVVNLIVDLIDPCGFGLLKTADVWDEEVKGWDDGYRSIMTMLGKQYPSEAQPELIKYHRIIDPVTGDMFEKQTESSEAEFNKYFNEYFRICNLTREASCRDNTDEAMALNAFRQGRLKMANNLTTNMINPYAVQPAIINEISIGNTSLLAKVAVETDIDILMSTINSATNLIEGKTKLVQIEKHNKKLTNSLTKILASEAKSSIKKLLYNSIIIVFIILMIVMTLPI